jgi:hypothetical protein
VLNADYELKIAFPDTTNALHFAADVSHSSVPQEPEASAKEFKTTTVKPKCAITQPQDFCEVRRAWPRRRQKVELCHFVSGGAIFRRVIVSRKGNPIIAGHIFMAHAPEDIGILEALAIDPYRNQPKGTPEEVKRLLKYAVNPFTMLPYLFETPVEPQYKESLDTNTALPTNPQVAEDVEITDHMPGAFNSLKRRREVDQEEKQQIGQELPMKRRTRSVSSKAWIACRCVLS